MRAAKISFTLVIKILILAVLLFPEIVFGQSYSGSTLFINTSNCKDSNRFGNSILLHSTIEIHKLNQTKPLYIKDSRHHDNKPIKVNGLAIGIYEIRFKNIFFETISKVIELKETGINYIELCPERLNEYQASDLVSSLSGNDSITVESIYAGHKYASSRKIVIRKIQSSYECSLWCGDKKCGDEFPRWNNVSISYKLIKQIILSEQNLNQLIYFQQELNALMNSDALLIQNFRTTYLMTSKKGSVKKYDSGNSWRGFYYLQKALFGVSE